MKIENRQQFLIVLTAVAFALLIGNSLIYDAAGEIVVGALGANHRLAHAGEGREAV